MTKMNLYLLLRERQRRHDIVYKFLNLWNTLPKSQRPTVNRSMASKQSILLAVSPPSPLLKVLLSAWVPDSGSQVSAYFKTSLKIHNLRIKSAQSKDCAGI